MNIPTLIRNLSAHVWWAVLLFAFAPASSAQQPIDVSGTVKDPTGQPLAGVTVSQQGVGQALAMTGADGTFALRAPADASLVFSLIGYGNEVAVAGPQPLQVVMTAVVANLDEVVVVGFGTTKKVNLTGSVTAVSGEELAKRQVGQSSMALQGVVPGVTVTQTTGQPGVDGGTIRVRGIGTLNNSNPLVLVDG